VTKPPTLIDKLYKMSFRNASIPGWRSNAAIRERLAAAERFVLSDRMSAFTADLALQGFLGATRSGNRGLQLKLAEQLRVSARLPHKVTWVEYNLRAASSRVSEILGRPPLEPGEVPDREGWLLERHPDLDHACRVHLFNDSSVTDKFGFDTWSFPIAFGWTTSDQPLPWRVILTGLRGYSTPLLDIIESDLLIDPRTIDRDMVKKLIVEWAGVVRRMWALLATINDIPVVMTEVKQSRGFLGKGQIRKFLSHQVVTLDVPQRTDARKLARKVLALARRRAHQVREHFRADWRRPPSKQCPALVAHGAHFWGTDNVCTECHGHRIIVHEHQRGDASLGFVTRSYSVEHKESN
jgi:hypothetical protein